MLSVKCKFSFSYLIESTRKHTLQARRKQFCKQVDNDGEG